MQIFLNKWKDNRSFGMLFRENFEKELHIELVMKKEDSE